MLLLFGESNNSLVKSLPGLKLWTDASTTSLGAVSSWVDKSGGGNSLVQVTPASRPVNTANQINGRQAVVFDGVNDYLATAAFSGGDIAVSTMFFVAKNRVTGIPATAGTYLADGIDIVKRQAVLRSDLANLLEAYAGSFIVSATPADTVAHVHTVVFNGASSAYYLDNSSIATGNVGSAALAGFTLGARYSAENFFDGAMGEVLVYNRALSSSERNVISQYLKIKWGTA